MIRESKHNNITREALQNWRVAALVRERDGTEATVASEEQLLKSRRAIVHDNADCGDYGCLDIAA